MIRGELDAAFASKFIERYGAKYLKPDDALDFIEKAKDRLVAVEGLRIFPKGHSRFPEGGIQPDMDLLVTIEQVGGENLLRECSKMIKESAQDPLIVFEIYLHP